MSMRSELWCGSGRWVLAAVLFAGALASGSCQSVAPGSDRHVLVMDFETSEESLEKYSTALAEMTTGAMANNPRVAVLERQDIRTREFGAPSYYWRKMGRKVGADYLMFGSIARLDDNYIVNARLYSCTTGEIVKGSSTTRACRREDDIYPSVQAISAVMAHHLKYLAELYDSMAVREYYGVAPQTGAVPEAPAADSAAH